MWFRLTLALKSYFHHNCLLDSLFSFSFNIYVKLRIKLGWYERMGGGYFRLGAWGRHPVEDETWAEAESQKWVILEWNRWKRIQDGKRQSQARRQEEIGALLYERKAWVVRGSGWRWSQPAILATWEAKIRNIVIQSQPRANITRDPFSKKPIPRKGLVEWLPW
jgi:hypothetical protein